MLPIYDQQDSAWYERTLQFASRHLRDAEPVEVAWRKAGEYGVLGLMAPEELGGSGLNAYDSLLVMEALGRGCQSLGLPFGFAAHAFACVVPVMDFAEPELRSTALPKLTTGDWIGANAITESEAGSDVYALRTRAKREGDVYVLDGVKSFVTNGNSARVAVVYARSSESDGYLGISAFLVDLRGQGVRVGAPLRKLGLEQASICSIVFDTCRVPVSHRLGVEGQGAAIFEHSMAWERCCLFGLYLGAMERQLEQCVQRAKERLQGGRPIGAYQAVSHRIANMKLRLDSARLLLRRSSWLLSQGKGQALDWALAKLAVSEAAVASSLDAIQIFGADGVMCETRIGAALLDALPSQVFSGTSDIQRNVIAAELGLRESRKRGRS